MIKLRLPGAHPDSAVIHRWASDQETTLDTHAQKINKLEGIIRTILANNPNLGKNS